MNLSLIMRMVGISEADVKTAVETQVMPVIENLKREYQNVDGRYSQLLSDVLARLVVIDGKLDAIDRVLNLEGVSASQDLATNAVEGDAGSHSADQASSNFASGVDPFDPHQFFPIVNGASSHE